MDIRLLTNDKDKWNNFVQKCEMGTLFQSYEWSVEMQRRGWAFDILALEDNNTLLGGAAVYWQKVPLLNKVILNIPYGPVWNSDKNIFNVLCEKIVEAGEKRNALFIEFQIYLPAMINGTIIEKYEYIHNILLSKGFRKSPKSLQTYRINLNEAEDDIFGRLAKNHRRDIRKAERENVKVNIGDDPNLVDLFYRYYSDMFNYKNLTPMPKDFFVEGLKDLLRTGKCKIFYAEYEETIYNMAIISLFGTPMYVWGASIKSSNKPPMGQLLHWEIIKWLKKNNYSSYDLGGTPGNIPQQEHPNYWVWRFKKGFNGDYIESLGCYEYVFNKSLYWLYEKIIPIHRKYFSKKR
jgi:lipid II:glycine glycyltransferase (peptidoglycan interpeptide bridge formation enzyme)